MCRLSEMGCAESCDPRKSGSCYRCGRQMPPSGDLVRDLDDEREIKEYGARLAKLDVDSLIAFAEARALPGPVRDADARDYGLDAAEEYADASNYLVWWVQAIDRKDDDYDWSELRMTVVGAMVKCFEAWAALQHARATARELER